MITQAARNKMVAYVADATKEQIDTIVAIISANNVLLEDINISKGELLIKHLRGGGSA